MKKVIALAVAFVFSTGLFAQETKEKVKKAKKETEKVVADKKEKSKKEGEKLKKDGTPDKRYKNNKTEEKKPAVNTKNTNTVPCVVTNA